MKCPIIVLVDTDEDYVVSLALRFATTYGNTIDLRVITDAAYYKTMFQERQHADVLLISDTL